MNVSLVVSLQACMKDCKEATDDWLQQWIYLARRCVRVTRSVPLSNRDYESDVIFALMYFNIYLIGITPASPHCSSENRFRQI